MHSANFSCGFQPLMKNFSLLKDSGCINSPEQRSGRSPKPEFWNLPAQRHWPAVMQNFARKSRSKSRQPRSRKMENSLYGTRTCHCQQKSSKTSYFSKNNLSYFHAHVRCRRLLKASQQFGEAVWRTYHFSLFKASRPLAWLYLFLNISIQYFFCIYNTKPAQFKRFAIWTHSPCN